VGANTLLPSGIKASPEDGFIDQLSFYSKQIQLIVKKNYQNL
jgi:hypothetical protein